MEGFFIKRLNSNKKYKINSRDFLEYKQEGIFNLESIKVVKKKIRYLNLIY